jgi:outer membrane protein assembly factor BamD
VFTNARSALVAFLSALLLLGGIGCSHPWNALPEGSYERGKAEAEGGASLDAIEDLKLFIRRNPQDPLADDAQFLVGKTYMETEDYPVAAVEFEIMQVDYPNSELVDDAAYLEALSYVRQVPDYRLDQTITKKAMDKLDHYLKTYPSGKHLKEARDELDQLQAKLDRKHYDSAAFYKRRGHLVAANQVLDNILKESPNSQLRPQVLLLKGQTEFKLKNYKDAVTALRELVDRWPDSKIRGKAESLLKKAEKAAGGDAS